MPASHTIIQFHESHCRVYHWQSNRGEYTLEKFLPVPLRRSPTSSSDQKHPGPNASLTKENGETLRQALREAGLRVTEALVLISQHGVTLRVVTLPSSDPAELPEMARYEAARHIPFNIERHVVSHHILDVEGIQGSQVVLAALDGPRADAIIQTLESAGIHITALEVSTLALANSLLYSGQWDTEKQTTIAQIDIDFETTDITILHEGKPLFARSISLGTNRLFVTPAAQAPEAEIAAGPGASMEDLRNIDLLREAPQTTQPTIQLDAPPPETSTKSDALPDARSVQAWANRLVQDIRQTFDFARREFDCAPLSDAYLTGPGILLKNIRKVLESGIPGLKIRGLDPFGQGSSIATAKLVVAPDAVASLVDPSAHCAAVGALLRDVEEDSLKINLLPQPYIETHRRSRRQRSMVTTAGLVAGLLACLCLGGMQRLTVLEEERDFLQSELERNSEREEDIRYKETVIRILRRNSSKQGSALAILDTVSGWHDLLDEENMRIALTDFVYKADVNVKLMGHAMTHEDLNEFRDRLGKSGHFRQVKTESRPPITLPYFKEHQVLRFTLNCYFPKAGKKGAGKGGA